MIIFVLLRERKQYVDRLETEMRARLNYIHILIDTVYSFGNNSELLLTQLKKEMSVKKLLLYGIIKRRQTEACDPELKISEDDRLLYQLLQEGFSPRELCIIFSLNNINSLYVKHHRIRKKLGLLSDEKAEPTGETTSAKNRAKASDRLYGKQMCANKRSATDVCVGKGRTYAEKKEPAEV